MLVGWDDQFCEYALIIISAAFFAVSKKTKIQLVRQKYFVVHFRVISIS